MLERNLLSSFHGLLSEVENKRTLFQSAGTLWYKKGSVWGELQPADVKQGLFGNKSRPHSPIRIPLGLSAEGRRVIRYLSFEC